MYAESLKQTLQIRKTKSNFNFFGTFSADFLRTSQLDMCSSPVHKHDSSKVTSSARKTRFRNYAHDPTECFISN